MKGGVISLYYANDIILFVDKDEEWARNLKWILTCFELSIIIKVGLSPLTLKEVRRSTCL
jgi:hypothetical protein